MLLFSVQKLVLVTVHLSACTLVPPIFFSRILFHHVLLSVKILSCTILTPFPIAYDYPCVSSILKDYFLTFLSHLYSVLSYPPVRSKFLKSLLLLTFSSSSLPIHYSIYFHKVCSHNPIETKTPHPLTSVYVLFAISLTSCIVGYPSS